MTSLPCTLNGHTPGELYGNTGTWFRCAYCPCLLHESKVWTGMGYKIWYNAFPPPEDKPK